MLHSGLEVRDKKKLLPLYKSGDKILDKLLSGGFRQDLVYLLYGDRNIIVDIMINFFSSFWLSLLIFITIFYDLYKHKMVLFKRKRFKFTISIIILISKYKNKKE